jgi:hypothetical protein
MLAFLRPERRPSIGEAQSFERFKVGVQNVASTLSSAQRGAAGGPPERDILDGEPVALLLDRLRAAAREHLHRSDDLLTLVERVTATDSVGGTSLARVARAHDVFAAIAMAELLQHEARRYRRLRTLRAAADDAMRRLARAFASHLGPAVPSEVGRAFPRFAAAVRDCASQRH